MNQQQDDQVTWLACMFKQVMPFEVIEAQYMEPTPPMGMAAAVFEEWKWSECEANKCKMMGKQKQLP